MIKGILFDKDGTLIDFFSLWLGAARKVVAEFQKENGISGSQEMTMYLLNAMGVTETGVDPKGALAYKSYGEIGADVAAALKNRGIFLEPERAGRRLEQLFGTYAAGEDVQMQPLADLKKLTAELKQRNIRIGLATADTQASAENCLKAMGVLEDFDYVGADDGRRRPKPWQDMFLEFQDQFHLKPREIAVVGDTGNDMLFARKNGGLGIGVLSGVSQAADLEECADYVIPSVQQLPGLLDKLVKGEDTVAELQLKHVYKRFEDGVTAVKDFQLEVKGKEFIVFVGPSGCGKSTTLRMIAGLEEISDGEFYMDGKCMNQVPSCDRDIAMVFQNYALYPHMSVAENIAYSMRLKGVPRKERQKKTAEVAEKLGLKEVLDRKPRELSGGQKQRVAMGRAMVRKPRVFLMDEPLSNLDAKLRNQMRSEIAHLYQELDSTFIYVTHDQVEAMTLGTRIVVMNQGEIQQIAPPQELYDHPANIFVAGFIGTPPMNLMEADCEPIQGVLHIKVGDACFPVTEQQADVLRRKDYINEKIVLGIRPEHIRVSETGALAGIVKGYELLGADALVYLECKEKTCSIKVSADQCIRRGDSLRVTFDMEKAHLFDRIRKDRIC